jgi:aminopeptidase YwaD
MNNHEAYCQAILVKLCQEIPERCVGSKGNRMATRYFEEEAAASGWEIKREEFEAMDWEDGGAHLTVEDQSFDVFASPYSLGCEVQAELISASTLEDLEHKEFTGRVMLLHGEIAKEQLMPKNFVFYNPEEHQRIISLLEAGRPIALLCATGHNASLAGGVYPFPLIEDGDFDIPSVYMTEEEGQRLLPLAGKNALVRSGSQRIPGKGYQVSAFKGSGKKERIVISAHIDAKKGTPGALDNATGVAVLLLAAKMLTTYHREPRLELAAFNGEDYYAAPGQMLYLRENEDRFEQILLNINIDGAGYKEGKSAFSFYGLPPEWEEKAKQVIERYAGIQEGKPWVQGDHSMFIQNGRPAMAVSSDWFSENIDTQTITHTPNDNLGIVDSRKVVEIAEAICDFVQTF